MTVPYKHLTEEQRYHIAALRKTGISQAGIAKEIGCHPSTISRELDRNTGKRGYRPKQANEFANARKGKGNKQLGTFAFAYVSYLLKQYCSPEQIHGRLLIHGWKDVISIERIYQYIYADKASGVDLHTYLRCQKQRRKRYASGQQRRGQLSNRRGLQERPPEVEKRSRLGDLEGDTIIGARHKGVLLTLVDRKARTTNIRPMPNKQASVLAEQSIEVLNQINAHTVTYDNGKEFADHQVVSQATGVDIFFADPYASWQRGTNENTNGLIRQFFPKSMRLDKITRAQTEAVEKLLNNRPRKVLGFKTPNEVLSNPQGVALET